MMIQERAKDLQREAEQERLARQALAGREAVVGEKVKELFLRFTKPNPAKEKECASCPSATDMAI